MINKKYFICGTVLIISFAIVASMFGASIGKYGEEKNYIIVAKSNMLPRGLAEAIESFNGEITKTFDQVGIAFAKSSDSRFSTKASKIKGIRSVVPDFQYQWVSPSYDYRKNVNPSSIGDDEPLFSLQWALDAIDAPEAWNTGALGTGVRVAVLDSGIDPSHPDLAPNLNVALSLSLVLPSEPFIDDLDGHGTHVAGIIGAADNAFGTIGVAPEVEIVVVKVLNQDGVGLFSWLLNGVLYATSIDADIINMSIGAYIMRHGFLDDLGEWIPARAVAEFMVILNRIMTFAYQNGVTIIATAGNEMVDMDHARDLVHIPSGATHVLSISATGPVGWIFDQTTDLDVPAIYTNYGQSVVDFAAPGGNVDPNLYPNGPWFYDCVLSTFPGGWAWMGGTSQAAPHVAGVAALIIERNGGPMHPAQVEAILKQSADDLGKRGKDDYYGHGRVNAYKAVTRK